jgi:phosphate transport system protein
VLHIEVAVNTMEKEIDDRCIHILAKRQPTATDLRLVMTATRMIRDLERVGDEAKKIAKKAKKLSQDSSFAIGPQIEIAHLGECVTKMLHQVLDAYARNDIESATDVLRQDERVNHGFKALMRQLVTFMMEDPRTISRCLEIIFIAKSLERIGDHATNMAEHVIYMVNGIDLRHQKLHEIEQATEKASTTHTHHTN